MRKPKEPLALEENATFIDLVDPARVCMSSPEVVRSQDSFILLLLIPYYWPRHATYSISYSLGSIEILN